MCNRPVIVITGSSRRLGLFLCENFLAKGFRVAALTRTASASLNALAKNDNIEIFPLDTEEGTHVSTPDAVMETKKIAQVVQQLRQRYGHLFGLIHNASAFAKDGESFSIEDYLAFFHTHMAMPAQLNESLYSQLYDEDKPGNIIHITDIFSDNPNPAFALYCSTKAALENLSKSFAKKFAPGIRVNSIQPGPIQFLASHSERDKQQVLAETLLPFEGGFMPIFQAICAIIDNPYMTGSSVKVDGGRALSRA